MASLTSAAPARRRSFEPLQPIWRILTSVRFAVFFIATLAAFGLLGVFAIAMRSYLWYRASIDREEKGKPWKRLRP